MQRLKRKQVINSPQPNSDLLSVKQLAKQAGISTPTLFRLWKRGEGPKRIKIGSKVFVTKPCYEEWIKELSEESRHATKL